MNRVVVEATNLEGVSFRKMINLKPYPSYSNKHQSNTISVLWWSNWIALGKNTIVFNVGEGVSMIDKELYPPSMFVVPEENLDNFQLALLEQSPDYIIVYDNFFEYTKGLITSLTWGQEYSISTILQNEAQVHKHFDTIEADGKSKALNKNFTNYKDESICYIFLSRILDYFYEKEYSPDIISDFENCEFHIDAIGIYQNIKNMYLNNNIIKIDKIHEIGRKTYVKISSYEQINSKWQSAIDEALKDTP